MTDRQSILNQEYANALLARDVQFEKLRPFHFLLPRVFPDGDKWCALYGDNLQDGVAAFGDTPEAAARQFDIEWLNAKPPSGKTESNKP